MSFPNVPNITPTIEIDQEQCVNMLLASVAMEELGLSHIINAEAEKLQYVLGTLPGKKPPTPPTIKELRQVADSVARTIRTVEQNQLLLTMKMEDILHLYGWKTFVNVGTVTAEFNGTTISASDSAYYHTQGGVAV